MKIPINHTPESAVQLPPPELSVLIPVYNEVANVEPLHAELDRTLKTDDPPLRADLRRRWLDRRHGGQLAAIQDRDPDHVRVAFLQA